MIAWTKGGRAAEAAEKVGQGMLCKLQAGQGTDRAVWSALPSACWASAGPQQPPSDRPITALLTWWLTNEVAGSGRLDCVAGDWGMTRSDHWPATRPALHLTRASHLLAMPGVAAARAATAGVVPAESAGGAGSAAEAARHPTPPHSSCRAERRGWPALSSHQPSLWASSL